MLPITNHETQSAVRSNQAAARAPQREGGESFADTMQRAQTAPEKQGAAPSDADAQRKPVDAAADATASEPSSDADVATQPAAEVIATQLISLVKTAQSDVAPRGKVAVKAAHVSAKHGKHAAANGGGDVAASPESAALANGCAAAGSTQTLATAQNAGAGVSASASAGGKARGLKLTAGDQGLQAVGAASGDKSDGPQTPMMDVSSAGDEAAGKVRQHESVEAAKTEVAAPVEKTEVSGALTAVHEIARTEGGHGLRGSAGATGAASAAGSTAWASAGDELNVYSYEAPASNRLEIGVAGGSWGWLKVRAEMGPGGEVHAFLRGASTGAESALRAQAGDLQVYLGTQQVGVHAVHVEASRSAGWAAGAGMGDGDRQPAPQREQAPERSQAGLKPTVREEVSNQWLPLPRRLHGAGGWLNVLA